MNLIAFDVGQGGHKGRANPQIQSMIYLSIYAIQYACIFGYWSALSPD